jgi:hypothetical protein
MELSRVPVMTRALRFLTARQVFEAFPPAARDIETSPTDDDPLVFLRSLIEGPIPEDAISFCAYMLPRREAVWWGCQCVRHIEGQLSATDEQFMTKAEAWVKDPEEDTRREVQEMVDRSPLDTPASWIAVAAAWSGGSISGPGNPPVSPPPHATAQAVRAAVLTSLAKGARHERRDNLVACVRRALGLVDPELAKFPDYRATVR